MSVSGPGRRPVLTVRPNEARGFRRPPGEPAKASYGHRRHGSSRPDAGVTGDGLEVSPGHARISRVASGEWMVQMIPMRPPLRVSEFPIW
jgi:hypothetical protein